MNTVRPEQRVQIEYSISEEKMNAGKANFDMGLLMQGRATDPGDYFGRI